MKRTMLSVLMIIVSCLVYADISITDVTAQQRYPWNGKVDITYTVNGDIIARAKEECWVTALKVSAIDQSNCITNVATELSGDISLAEGTHRIVWDMNAQGLTCKSRNVVFDVSCEVEKALYCIVDLSSGSSASKYSVSYTNEIPDGSWSDEYKTTKLVLRRIDPGTCVVTVAEPYYVGVFEFTQKQYALVTGKRPAYYTNDKNPVERVSFDMIRGGEISADNIIGRLRSRTHFDFDLPTETQWEYACRAGTSTKYNYGDIANGDYMWYEGNSLYLTREVGTREPNLWGLYDFHGNVWEWCLDWYSDPWDSRGVRGGSYDNDASVCVSAKISSTGCSASYKYETIGFRLVRPLSGITIGAFDSGTALCGDCSTSTVIDLTAGVRIAADIETLTYSTEWDDGVTDESVAIVTVNGNAICEKQGSGKISWTPMQSGTYTLIHKVMDADQQIGETLTATFEVLGVWVETPVVQPITSSFTTVSQEVMLSCETEGAEIYYTIDGSEPSAANGRRYNGPFDIWQTTTVKAIAVKDDWKDSAVVSATFTKENAVGPAINLLEVLPDNDKTHPWEVVTDVTHDGVSAVKSGAIEDEESTTVKAVIYGAGELSFWWRSSCEPSIGGECYDYGTFYNGTTAVTNIAGVTDWQQVRLVVAGTGKHTFKWTYTKDDSGSTVPDGIWLDQVQWLPETTDYYVDHTLTTETPVEYKWLRKYGLGVTNDFEAAAKAKSGKRDGAGRELTVEDDYIAGTDPTNMTSQLTSQIEMIDGVPNITWNPDLEGDRTYKIWGSTNLVNGGEWEYPTNALHHFFKVTVEIPQR